MITMGAGGTSDFKCLLAPANIALSATTGTQKLGTIGMPTRIGLSLVVLDTIDLKSEQYHGKILLLSESGSYRQVAFTYGLISRGIREDKLTIIDNMC